MALDNVPVLDDFNRTNAATSLGSNWSALHAEWGMDGSLGINTNQCYSSFGGGGYGGNYYNQTTFTTGRRVKWQILASGGSDQQIGLIVAYNPSNGAGVMLDHNAGSWSVDTFDGGTTWGSIGDPGSQALAAGSYIAIEITDDLETLMVYYSTDGTTWGAPFMTIDVSGWNFTSQIYVGAYLRDTTNRLDNFGAEPFSAGGSPATISAPTPSGTLETETTATLGCTTDTSEGTLYGVVDTASLSGIEADDIKGGFLPDGTTPALWDGSNAVTGTSPTIAVTGLTADTNYNYALVHTTGDGDSNVLTGSFTTAAEAEPSEDPRITLTDIRGPDGNLITGDVLVKVWDGDPLDDGALLDSDTVTLTAGAGVLESDAIGSPDDPVYVSIQREVEGVLQSGIGDTQVEAPPE